MSKITLSGNASGTGTFTLASPDSNTDRTLNLPDAGGTMVLDTATQTLTNKTIQGGALTLATAVTASGTAIDYTGIPAWVKRITVMFSLVSTNGTSGILIQIGDAGGIETTGYVSVTAIVGGIVTTGYSVFSNAAARITSGSVELTNITGNTWVANGQLVQSDIGYLPEVAGNKELSAILDRVRVTTVNGTDTFDAGTINIMYEG